MKPEDYEQYEENVLQAIMQFHSIFANYIKDMDPELWRRAVDFAKDYAKSGNVTFNYSKEKTPELILDTLLSQTIFIKDLITVIEETKNDYIAFVEQNKNLEVKEIMDKWLTENSFTADDPFGYEKDLKVFIECDHKFSFDKFDDEDWENYTNVCVFCIHDKTFQYKYLEVLKEHHGDPSELYDFFKMVLDTIPDMNNMEELIAFMVDVSDSEEENEEDDDDGLYSDDDRR